MFNTSLRCKKFERIGRSLWWIIFYKKFHPLRAPRIIYPKLYLFYSEFLCKWFFSSRYVYRWQIINQVQVKKYNCFDQLLEHKRKGQWLLELIIDSLNQVWQKEQLNLNTKMYLDKLTRGLKFAAKILPLLNFYETKKANIHNCTLQHLLRLGMGCNSFNAIIKLFPHSLKLEE